MKIDWNICQHWAQKIDTFSNCCNVVCLKFKLPCDKTTGYCLYPMHWIDPVTSATLLCSIELGSMQCTNQNRSCIWFSLNSHFYFRFCPPLSTKSAFCCIGNFVPIWWQTWWPNRNRHTSKVGYLLSVCYFPNTRRRVEPITFRSRVQNLLKISNELRR